MHHTFCIFDFKIYAYVLMVFCSGFSYCNDWIPVVQLFLHIVFLGGQHYEHFKKEKTSWLSCALHRLGSTLCCNGSNNRVGSVLSNLPYLHWSISY